jgi:hypothetical protein
MSEERLYVKLYDRTDDADATVEFNDEEKKRGRRSGVNA